VPERGRDEFFRGWRHRALVHRSRQLLGGASDSGWDGPDKKVFVALSEDEAEEEAHRHYGRTWRWARDPTCSTWFSRAVAVSTWLARPDHRALRSISTSVLGVTGWNPVLLGRPHDDDGHAVHDPSCRFAPSNSRAVIGDEKGQKECEVQGKAMDPWTEATNTAPSAALTMASLAPQRRRLRLATSTSRREGSRNFRHQFWECHAALRMNGRRLATSGGKGNEAGLNPRS